MCVRAIVRERVCQGGGLRGLIVASSVLAAITCWPQLFALPATIVVTPRQRGRKIKGWTEGGKG